MATNQTSLVLTPEEMAQANDEATAWWLMEHRAMSLAAAKMMFRSRNLMRKWAHLFPGRSIDELEQRLQFNTA